MEKEMILQKGFDVIKLEDRCEMVNAAAADWSITSDKFGASTVAEMPAEALLY